MLKSFEIFDIHFISQASAVILGWGNIDQGDKILITINDSITCHATLENNSYSNISTTLKGFKRIIFFDKSMLSLKKCTISAELIRDDNVISNDLLTININEKSAFNNIASSYAQIPSRILYRHQWKDNLTPKLTTVILAVHNGERYLDHAITSVLEQSDSNFQFIIINDGSLDSSQNIIQKYAKLDPRITPIFRPIHEGQGAALSRGIEQAKGDLTCFIDANDFWYSNKIQYIRDIYCQNNQMGKYTVYQHMLNITDDNNVPQDLLQSGLLSADVINHYDKDNINLPIQLSPISGLAFPTEVLRAVFPIPQTFRNYAGDFLTRTAATLGYNFSIPIALGAYRTTDINETAIASNYNPPNYINNILIPAINQFYLSNNISLFVPINSPLPNTVCHNKIHKIKNNSLISYQHKLRPIIKSLNDFKNIHKGKRAFLIASGSNLKTIDLELLKDEITYSRNDIMLNIGEAEWQPTYYASIDAIAYENSNFNCNEIPSTKFFPEKLKDQHQSLPDTYFLNYKKSALDKNKFLFEFSKDITQGIVEGNSALYFLMQIAYYMGIDKLYLIGLGPEFEKAPFQAARNSFEEDGREIINASNKSKTDIFRKVELKKIMNSLRKETNHTHLISDVYGCIDNIVYDRQSSSLAVSGWVVPEPIEIHIIHQGHIITSQYTSRQIDENLQLVSTCGIHQWVMTGSVTANTGDFIKVAFKFEDGTLTQLSQEI